MPMHVIHVCTLYTCARYTRVHVIHLGTLYTGARYTLGHVIHLGTLYTWTRYTLLHQKLQIHMMHSMKKDFCFFYKSMKDWLPYINKSRQLKKNERKRWQLLVCSLSLKNFLQSYVSQFVLLALLWFLYDSFPFKVNGIAGQRHSESSSSDDAEMEEERQVIREQLSKIQAPQASLLNSLSYVMLLLFVGLFMQWCVMLLYANFYIFTTV